MSNVAMSTAPSVEPSCPICHELISKPACGLEHIAYQRGWQRPTQGSNADEQPLPGRILPDRVKLIAMRGRCLLQFPPPITQIRGVEVPDEAKLRREVGTLVAIGRPRNRSEAVISRDIMRLTGNTTWQRWREKHLPSINRWLGWVRPRALFMISMQTGGYYWRKELGAYGDEFAFMQDIRVYNITDLPVAIVEDKRLA